MNIRSRSAIHEEARRALDRAPYTRKTVLIYTAVCCGLSFLTTLLTVFLSDRIDGAGGLGNIGLRSILSTGQSVLPLIQFIITSCLGLGYHITMLTVTRGYEASPRILLQGFRHFGPLLRAMLLQGIVYFGVALAATYGSSFLFLMTPLAGAFMEVLEPLVSSMTAMDTGIILDEATLVAATEAMLPMFWILIPVFLLLFVPVHYGFRMVNFCLAEDPRRGALFALAKSRRLMRRNRIALFRLDLTLWWYYLGTLLVVVACYGDALLPMLGIVLPWDPTISFYAFYLLSIAMQIILNYFAMNRVYAVYAVAYDALQDQMPSLGGGIRV